MNTANTFDPKALDLVRIADIGNNLRALMDEMRVIFPERSSLLQQLTYALLTRHHVLIHGTR